MVLILEDRDSLQFIDNTNSAFYNTKFSKFAFKVFYKPLTSTKELEIEKKHTIVKRGIPKMDQAAIKIEKFDKIVHDWEGIFVQKNGKPEEITCTKENKRFLVENYTGFVNLINTAILQNETGFLDDYDQDSVIKEDDEEGEDTELGN